MPDGLRGKRSGDRRSGRYHPPRRGRRDARRRRAQHDPSLRNDGLRALDGHVDSQRRACSGEPPVRPGTRRVRDRRRGRDAGAGGFRARPRRGATIYGEVAGHASTADAFRLTEGHDDGRGAVVAMRLALEDAKLNPRRRRLHQRPRHEHQGERLCRDPRDQARARRIGLQDSRSRAPRA